MKQEKMKAYEKPTLGVLRAPVTLMENYSRKPGKFSRENRDYEKSNDNYENDPLWD